MNRWRSRSRTWISSQRIKLHVPVTRSYRFKHLGWLKWSLVLRQGAYAACAHGTPDDSSNIVLGRYNGTVVAWARLLAVETPCHSADEQRAKLLHGYCNDTACEVIKPASQCDVWKHTTLPVS